MTTNQANERGSAFRGCRRLTVLPLRELVVFPYMVVPLFVGRQKSLKAIQKALESTREILVVTQKTAGVDDPGPADVYDVGTVAQVLQVFNLPDGILKILVEGIYRARIREFITTDEHFEVLTEEIPDSDERTPRLQALMRNVVSLFEQYIKLTKKVPQEIAMVASSVDSSGRLVDIITTHLNLKVEEKQEILAGQSPDERLERLAELLQKEIDIHVIEKRISDRVRKQMEHLQREYYLREQVKAIQKELGDKDDIQLEIEEYKKRVAEAKMPEQAHQKAMSELERLAKLGYGSAESSVIRSFLDVLCDLPWSRASKDNLDLHKAARVLDRDHFGLKEPKERILEYLSVCKLKRSIKGPILCFMGPPGVGKTSLARSIADSMGRKFVRMSLGGIRDEAEIRGHRKTYVGAMPGRIVQLLRRANTNNPVFLLDEIDKCGTDWRGDPSSALLEVLDPEQNTSFQDHYLGVPFDLSKVLFITTANIPHTIPEPLRDRMEIIHLPGYTEEEKLKIAGGFLVPKQLKENGLAKAQIKFSDETIQKMVRHYTREAGIRELERKIGTVVRRIAKDIVTKKGHRRKIFRMNERAVEKYLGIARYRFGRTEDIDEIGVATGLGWTEHGGMPLPIEVVATKGQGKIILTGHLGDVMQESARAAVSYVRAHWDRYGVRKDFYKRLDLHIHAPEGAVPKDGPSAGITIAAAVVSALSNRPISRYLAMTGEVTLKGKVLPVGGIKEKILAAFRIGVKEIILPKENEKDLEEIPLEVRKLLKFNLVELIDQVLEIALMPKPALPPAPTPPPPPTPQMIPPKPLAGSSPPPPPASAMPR